MQNADVIIIGAGISGLAAGYWLAKAGAKVVVLDKGRMVSEASSRATGYLSLRGEEPLEAPLAAEAEKLWATLDEELGYPTEWTPKGRLWCATNEVDWAKLQLTFQHFQQSGIPFELIDGKGCREFVPGLTENAIGGIHTYRSGHANPQRTSQAFGWAFIDRGGVILEYTPAIDILVDGGKVKGVRTPQGVIYSDIVISCAGPQTPLIGRMIDVDIPVAAVRLEAAITAPLPPMFEIAMIANGLSVRQTKRGNLHINGGPHEWVSVDLATESPKPNTPIVRNMANRLIELLPAVANVPLIRAWAGIVDVTPDQVCIIDRLTSPEGMIVAVSSGHGFGMAVSVGLALSELALQGKTSMPISGLGLSRFSNLSPDWRESHQWQPGAYNT